MKDPRLTGGSLGVLDDDEPGPSCRGIRGGAGAKEDELGSDMIVIG